MPHCKIEIEEIQADRWVAEVEIGGLQARRVRVTGTSDIEIMLAVLDALHTVTPGGRQHLHDMLLHPGRRAHAAHLEAVKRERVAAEQRAEEVKRREAQRLKDEAAQRARSTPRNARQPKIKGETIPPRKS